MKSLLSILLIFVFTSCVSLTKNYSLPSQVQHSKFKLKDRSGDFFESLSTKFSKEKNELVTKRSLHIASDSNKVILEKSIAISSYGKMGKVNILRPKISQYHVWFDKKKYSTELKINQQTKSLDVKLRSPEKKWNGNKSIKFPKGTGLFCFFSQLEYCVSTTGFIAKAIKFKGGLLNFHIVWEGYPYFMDQYVNIPSELFAKAMLSYDGTLKDNENRFILEVAGQSLFIIFDKDNKLKKIYWVSQGYSKERK